MAKLYSQHQEQQTSKLIPKEETIEFLLNYSRALSVIKYNKLEFNSFLN